MGRLPSATELQVAASMEARRSARWGSSGQKMTMTMMMMFMLIPYTKYKIAFISNHVNAQQKYEKTTLHVPVAHGADATSQVASRRVAGWQEACALGCRQAACCPRGARRQFCQAPREISLHTYEKWRREWGEWGERHEIETEVSARHTGNAFSGCCLTVRACSLGAIEDGGKGEGTYRQKGWHIFACSNAIEWSVKLQRDPKATCGLNGCTCRGNR